MKGLTQVATLLALAIGLISCGTSQTDCLIDCSNMALKGDNKCAIDHPKNDTKRYECSKVYFTENDVCQGKCYGNR